MTCNNRTPEKSNRLLAHQEHRQISRSWKKAAERQSSPGFDSLNEFEGIDGVQQETTPPFESKNTCDPDEGNNIISSKSLQKKLIKGKSIPKIKSPLQKFDEIVSRELSSRRALEGGRECGHTFESSKKWSGLQFAGMTDFGQSKISPENKVSQGALHGMGKEIRDFDPTTAENEALMDAIEKLAQAQAFCRFDAAVKAAEAATASVPPEMAEEVAVACAKDYQSDIIDIINEKMSITEEKKPVEVIGYIGVTKLKDNV